MVDLLVFIGFCAVVFGVTVWMVKRGHIKDTDGDLIPDVVENAADAVKNAVEDVVTAPKKTAKKTSAKKTTVKSPSKKKATSVKKPRKSSTGGSATDVQESVDNIDKV